MPKLLIGTTEAARRLNVSEAIVRRLGRRIGISYQRGQGHEHLYSTEELSKMQALAKQGLRSVAAKERVERAKASKPSVASKSIEKRVAAQSKPSAPTKASKKA